MAKIFVSFLGIGVKGKEPGYDVATYSWNGHPATSCFAQVAEIAILGPSYFDRIVLLCTDESDRKHYALLHDELVALGCQEASIIKPEPLLPVEMDADKQWGWFETLLSCIEPGDEVTFDFTHGMRSVPIVFSSAIGFLARTKGITLKHVLYGWYERGREISPIVDMRDFYAINDWAEAVSRLTDDADARKLGELSVRGDVPALAALSEKSLVDAFHAMTDCIRNVDVNNIGAKVGAALDRVGAHRKGADGTARVLLDCVLNKFKGLAFDYPASGRYDEPYFRTQLAIITALLEHRLFMQAFTAMRECIGSLGMAGVGGKYGRKSMSSSDGRNYRTRFAEVFVNMIQFPETASKKEDRWRFEDGDPMVLATFEELMPWYRKLEAWGVIAILKEIAGKDGSGPKLLDYRNGFDHAWTARGEAPGDIAKKGEEYRDKLKRVIDLWATQGGAQLAEQASSQEEASDRVFLNFSNHPVSTWPEPQVQSALDLGLGQPTNLHEGMPLVDPGATTDAVIELAETLAARADGQVVGGAHVGGEATLSQALVRALQRRGIRCFVPTTMRRVVAESRSEDGTKRHIAKEYEFVQWREYARF